MPRFLIVMIIVLNIGSLAVADQLKSFDGTGGQHLNVGQPVSIFDHGLQVPIYSIELPPRWRINQNIATDLNDVWRFYSTYVLDLYGPNGEIVSNLFPVAVYPSQGQNWERICHQLFIERFGSLGRFQLGRTVESPLAADLFAKSSRVPGIRIFERDIQGKLHGKEMEGKLFATVGQTNFGSLIMYPSALLAPKGRLEETIQTMSRINASSIENPQYQMRSQQIMAQRNQHAQAIMQSRQDWFEAHMASMRRASQMRSQSNRAFSDYLKSGGVASRDNTYTTNDQFTDYLRDTTTFNDPYTGHRVTQQGQYDYWFTDRLGNYYGTNDPNFDPHSLRGEWFPIAPLGR